MHTFNFISRSLILILIILTTACSSTTACYNYAKAGVGYKVQETALYDTKDGSLFNDPISGRIEIGRQCSSISYGVSHHSQPFSGEPFNNDSEYQKTEIFIDYMYKF